MILQMNPQRGSNPTQCNCAQMLEQLELYALGELEDPQLIHKIEINLLMCVECRKKLNDLDTFVKVFSTAAA